MEDPITYYEVLEIAESASQEEIKKAYRRLSQEYHPDKVPSHLSKLRKDAEEKFKEIQEASCVLSHPDKRKEYDAQLQELRERTRHAVTEIQNGNGIAHRATPDTGGAQWHRVDVQRFREMLTSASSVLAWILGFIMSGYWTSPLHNVFIASGAFVAFIRIVFAIGSIAERMVASLWTLLLGGITLIVLHTYLPRVFIATEWALAYGLLAYLLARPLYFIFRNRARAIPTLAGMGAVALVISMALWGYNTVLDSDTAPVFEADSSHQVDSEKSIKKEGTEKALEGEALSQQKENVINTFPKEALSTNPSFSVEPTHFKVKIKSKPSGAVVMIDKKERGTTPLAIVLEKGPHGIALKKEGYETIFDMIEVNQNSQKEVPFALKSKTEEK